MLERKRVKRTNYALQPYLGAFCYNESIQEEDIMNKSKYNDQECF